MTDDNADYVAAEADIAAYWESLQSAENPNGVWYLERGDIHNLMDMATDEITELRTLVMAIYNYPAHRGMLSKEHEALFEKVKKLTREK